MEAWNSQVTKCTVEVWNWRGRGSVDCGLSNSRTLELSKARRSKRRRSRSRSNLDCSQWRTGRGTEEGAGECTVGVQGAVEEWNWRGRGSWKRRESINRRSNTTLELFTVNCRMSKARSDERTKQLGWCPVPVVAVEIWRRKTGRG